MKFKTKISRCLVMRKRRVHRRVKKMIQGEEIPSIVENPIKCLGNDLMKSLTDKESIEDTKKKLLSWLRTVDGSDMEYLESTKHGSTSMGSYQDLCVCSSYMKLQLLQSKPWRGK